MSQSSSSSFDPLRCAALHNKIISFIAPDAIEHHNNRLVHNFFVAYGENASRVRNKLSAPVITFLENIDVLIGDSVQETANFTPHLSMPRPRSLWSYIGGISWQDDLEKHENWVILYRGNSAIMLMALYFDMDTNLCTIFPDGGDGIPWPRQWYPLERALKLWLKLYEDGKFHPSYGEGGLGEEASYSRYIQTIDLARNLKAYNNLISAIEKRLPGSTIMTQSLVDEQVLDEFGISGFYRDFLLNARKPSFDFIAPGLRLPTSEWLRDTLTTDRGSERYQLVREEDLIYDPILDNGPNAGGRYVGEPLPVFWGPSVTPWPSNERGFIAITGQYLVNKISGLYIWPDDVAVDSARFILPYPIGQNGYIVIGNPTGSKEIQNDVLYQHGNCPFLDDHDPRLFTILDNWTKLVESGYWTVGPNGVEGGIDHFKRADTARDAWRYRIGVCCDEDLE